MAKQLTLKGTSGWGGKRKGAGRKNRSKTVNHMRRQMVKPKCPMHITMRLKDGLPTLRKRTLLKEFRESLSRAKMFGLRVIHFSIQSIHIHLIVEASSNEALSNGLRSLAGRFGKIVRRSVNAASRGPVFAGRYHMRLLESPTAVKNTLKYVLLNQVHHQNLVEHIDSYSSGSIFQDWRKLLGKKFALMIKDQAEFFATHRGESVGLSPPSTWLCREGWTRAT